MKVLIVAACFFAVASAGILGHSSYGYAPLAYQAGHTPVLDHNGYQLDTPDVAHAKAVHFAAHAEANARTGYGVYSAGPLALAHGIAAPVAYAGHYGQHIPVIGPNGVPLDTPEVAAGKIANAQAHIEAKARNGDLAHVVSPLSYAAHGALGYASHVYGAQHIPIIGANGVPLDTPEVAAGHIANAQAHIEAKARNGDLHAYAGSLVHYRKRRGILAGAYATPYAVSHTYPQHIPVIGANGVPLETPEVVAAKISHAAAHVEAQARNGDLAHVVAAPLAYAAHGIAAHGIAAHGIVAPLAYAHSHYAGPQHIPVIGANGVPLDTPEVAAGKIANAQAHVEAKARNGDLAHVVSPLSYAAHGAYAAPLGYASHVYGAQHIPIIGANGVPLDTPEVAAGHIANAQAHLEAKARNGDLAHYY